MSKFDFTKIIPTENHSYKKVKQLLIKNKIIVNNTLNKNIQRMSFIHNKQLIPIYESVYYHTNVVGILPLASIKERLYWLYNNINTYPTCRQCNIKLSKVRNNFTSDYLYGKFCSFKCNRLYNNPLNKYDSKQRHAIVKRGWISRSHIFSENHKLKMSIAANKESVKLKKKITNLKRYGVENPGVLGAYHSKTATKYILNFLEKNNINVNRCFYHDKNNNKVEFFQMIYLDDLKKQKYFSYDLIVFRSIEAYKNRDLKNIELVLEYNGPWHYTLNEVIGYEHELSTPYKNNTNRNTKLQVYNYDIIKLNHMLQFTSNIKIFWEKINKLENYEYTLKLN